MSAAESDPEWTVGFEDECWWSRLALPTLSSWSEQGKPMRLTQQSVAKLTTPASASTGISSTVPTGHTVSQ
jgi:hypothetical protein